MPRDPRHDILFEPVQIGPKTLRNRFYAGAPLHRVRQEKPGSQAWFRAMKAEGGWAAVCTEYALVASTPTTGRSPYIPARLGRRGRRANLALMADEAHRFDVARRDRADSRGGHAGNAPVAGSRQWRRPSSPATTRRTSCPRRWSSQTSGACTRTGCERPAARATAASTSSTSTAATATCRFSSFRPSTTSARTSTEARSRTARASGSRRSRSCSEAVGDDCAIAVRFCVEALGPAGVEFDEGLEFVRARRPARRSLGRERRLDYRVVEGLRTSRFFQEGYQLEWTGRVREATAKPIVGVGRLTSPDRMAEIIRTRRWDLIGAARPSIADPFLPKKIEEGRYGEMRECIGCNVCVIEGRGAATTSAAPRTPRRARSTVAAGTRSASSRPPTRQPRRARRRRRARRAWSARSFSASAASAASTSSTPRPISAGSCAGSRAFLAWANGAACSTGAAVQLDKLGNVEVLLGRPALRAGRARVRGRARRRRDGCPLVAGTGQRRSPTIRFPAADASLPHVLTPEQVMLEGKRPARLAHRCLRRRGVLHGRRYRRAPSRRGHLVELVTPAQARRQLCGRVARGAAPAPASPRRRYRPARRRRCSPEISEGGVRGQPTSTESRSSSRPTGSCSSRSASRTKSSTSSSCATRTRCAPSSIEGLYRIGDCVAPRIIGRGDLRRAPACAGDRLGESRAPAPVRAGAARARVRRRSP